MLTFKPDVLKCERLRQPLINDLIKSGPLVAPFKQTLVGSRAYFIVESRLSAAKPQVSNSREG